MCVTLKYQRCNLYVGHNLITCLLRKMHFLVHIVIILESNQIFKCNLMDIWLLISYSMIILIKLELDSTPLSCQLSLVASDQVLR